MSTLSVLIVEDDPDIVEVLRCILEGEGFAVSVAQDGAAGLSAALAGDFSLLILDLMLPSLTGIEVCKRIRTAKKNLPILMLTSKADEVNKVLGLEHGADDYVTKPFSIHEVLARVRALLRRAQRSDDISLEVQQQTVVRGALRIDLERRQVWLEQQQIDLTLSEFNLLLYLALHPGRAYTRDQIVANVFGYENAAYGNAISAHINRLRNKLGDETSKPRFIETVRGIGYRFVDPQTGDKT